MLFNLNMKLVLYFFLFPIIVFSQIKIQGNVYDEKGEPIFGVSVYIDGSTIGTVTDENGYFLLEIPSQINSVLVIRNMGYKTTHLSLQSIANPVKIVLQEDVKELREVFVENSLFTRKQMMKLFKEQFLGINPAGRNCIIENENEIYFNFDNKLFILSVYSDVPLQITNSYLGYKIEYQLQDFQCKLSRLSMNSEYVTNVLFGGYSLFTDIDNSKKIANRRLKSFEGSTLQFFRNLIENKWDKKEFVLYKGSFATNASEHFKVTKLENDTFNVEIISKTGFVLKDKYVNQFNILFNNKEQSKIVFNVSEFIVDSFGVYSNYENILLSGFISTKRVGDLLPTNFSK